MNKIYILSHKHLFKCGHEDDKLIGTFFSKEKALEVLENYKKLEGFKDNLEGFYIQECKIDEIDTYILNELIEIYKK